MKYELIENGYVFATVDADDAEAALDDQGEPRITDYGDGTESTSTTWRARNADDSDDYADRTYRMDPPEPECTGTEHDWQSPHAIVGGIEENPGCWGSGAGILSLEVCVLCGCSRRTDTGATDMSDGTTCTKVSYESGEYAEQVAALRAEPEEA